MQSPDLKKNLLWVLVLLLAPVPYAAAEPESAPAVEVVRGEGEGVPLDEERPVETREQKGGSVGYGIITRDGTPGRAAPYSYLHSSARGSLFFQRLEKDTNLELDGALLNGKDYHGDLLIDYRGDYRLHLRTESLFHNLDREILLPTTNFLFFSNDPTSGNLAGYGTRQELPTSYGISVTQDLAAFRYRLHDFPLHLNLRYWRLVREGLVQQRFSDTSFEGTGRTFPPGTAAASLLADPDNLVFAQPRQVEQWTQEATASIDSHLGWVDFIYSFKARLFEDRAATPTHDYARRTGLSGTEVVRGAGVQQHNENPDSRFLAHTVKLHTSVAGGMVGSASYSVEQRENLSRLTDTSGVRHKAQVQSAAADFSYTPFPEVSVALKYRHQEVDRHTPDTLTNRFFTVQEALRPAIDTEKDQVTVTASYRPARNLTLNGEYRGEFLQRNHVTQVPAPLSWGLPEHSTTSRGAFSLLYRPVQGARLSAKYGYSFTDNPSYGNSFEHLHEGEVRASYTSRNRFGGSASVAVRRGWNDHIRRFLIDFPFAPLPDFPTVLASYFETERASGARDTLNASTGVWYTPVERVTVSANYAYLSTEVTQPVLFTGVLTGSQAGSDFFTRSHVYGVNAVFSATQRLELSLLLQQVRSHTAFAPYAVAFSGASDTTGIRELSEQESLISTLSARGEYRFNSRMSASLDYSVRDYDEKNPVYSAYNGTVHAIGASLSASW